MALVWFGIELRALQYMRFFEGTQCDLEELLTIPSNLSLTGMRSGGTGGLDG
jgi:hypothetical protein